MTEKLQFMVNFVNFGHFPIIDLEAVHIFLVYYSSIVLVSFSLLIIF